MRGGKSLADRGVIPRLLSGIYRKCRKLEKDTTREAVANVNMSYYEIYNDKVYDLFEAPEKRTLVGLPLRENGGKTVVVGLTERPCGSLKEFEKLYDRANVNRSTSATKVSEEVPVGTYSSNQIHQLNAHSSRSHAVLCVKLSVTTGNEIRISTVSAIDLAGSEDNRRTENGKERLVESASINKSLFVLAQCVEAISKKQNRIPYRESKMTRILSLGQNNGLTIMILNLAPVRSYHLDTLSSLNFANRTKKIEVRELENEPIFKGCSRPVPSFAGPSILRQPLKPLASSMHNAVARPTGHSSGSNEMPAKAFSVYSDSKLRRPSATCVRRTEVLKLSSPVKRPSDHPISTMVRPTKLARRSPLANSPYQPNISKATIEDMIERKVGEILASRVLDQSTMGPVPEISEEVQRRLELLEQKIEGKDDGRAEGLTFLLMAKQHQVRGEEASALKMYELARDYFPGNAKLANKISKIRETLNQKKKVEMGAKDVGGILAPPSRPLATVKQAHRMRKMDINAIEEDEYGEASDHSIDADYQSEDGFHCRRKAKRGNRTRPVVAQSGLNEDPPTPRSRQLLDIINTRDIAQIRLLKGVGPKKAEAIIEALCAGEEDAGQTATIASVGQLGRLKGVGVRTVENMRIGLGGSLEV